MRDVRERIEKGFERLGTGIARHPLIALVASVGLVVLFAMHLPQITIDTSTEGFLYEDDPALIDYNAFRDRYGRDERIMLAIGPVETFSPAVMEKIEKIHHRIEAEVPYLADVTSLVNARNTRGVGDVLVVEDLLEDRPQSPRQWQMLKARAMNNPLYQNLLLSEDGRMSTIVIETLAYADDSTGGDALDDFDAAFGGLDETVEADAAADEKTPREYLTDAQNSEVVNAVRAIIQEESGEDFPILIAGSPVVNDFLKSAMISDMQTFMRLLVLSIAVVLFLMFRRVSGVFYPLLVVVLTLLATIGLMALTGKAIKLPTQILPSLLLAVGIGASVHVLAIFYRRFDESGDKSGAISYALGHSGLAIVMTSLTTMAGIGSFSLANVAPIADLGRFAAFGVLISLVLTVTLLPALLALTPLKPRTIHPEESPRLDRLLLFLSHFSVRHAKAIVGVSAVLMIGVLFMVSKVHLSHYPLGWFPEDNEIRVNTLKLDEALKGTVNAEVIVDFDENEAFTRPDRMQALERSVAQAEQFEGPGYFVGKVVSLATIVKEINRALNQNRSSAYEIPDDRDLIAQELLLFSNSGSDDLEDFTDGRYTQTRITHKIPYVDAIKGAPLMERLKSHYQGAFTGAEVTVTGLMPLLVRVFEAAVSSTAVSYVIASLSITAMMMVLLGSVRLGLISMVPTFAPILAGMALMVWLQIPFDMFMMLVGSIIIGLAVDDTIHFMHNFRRYYNATGSAELAINKTFLSTGRALAVTTVVLSLGFFVYLFASMGNIVNFGLIAGISITLALSAVLVLAPALMTLYVQSKKEKI
jgi:predicted RND superfamily exporter protein